MKEGSIEGRRGASPASRTPLERLRRIARLHLERLGRDRDLAVVFQVELRQSTKFMERFSSTHLREYLGDHPRRDRRRPGRRRCSAPTSTPPSAAKMFFGALDEMATNWILSRRRYALAADADAVVDLFPRRGTLHDAMTPAPDPHPRPCSAPARWARRSPPTSPTPACPSLLLDLTREAAREGLERARALKPDPFFTAGRACARSRPAASTPTSPRIAGCDWIIEAVVERLDIKQALLARVERHRAPARHRQLEHVGHPDRRARRGPHRRLPAALARHPLLQPAALPAAARDHPDRRHRPGGRRRGSRASPTTASARAWSSRRTRRTSSPTTSGCTAWCSIFEALDDRASTRSRRSTRSPARPSAARRARRSGRWTSPASTCWRTSLRNLAERLDRTRRPRGASPAAARRGADRARAGRREDRPGLLQAREGRRRQREILDARPGDDGVPRRSSPRKLAVARGGAGDRGRRASAIADAVPRQGQGRRVPARRRSAPTLVYAAEVAPDDRALDRRRGPRDAVGLRLGARAVRAVGRHRRRRKCSTRCQAPSVPPLVAGARRPGATASATARRRRGARPADAADREATASGRQEERGRQPRRPRRRRAVRRVPLEDERHRRRHGADAAAGVKEAERELRRRSSSATTPPNFSAGANLMLLLLEAQEGNWDEIDLMVRAFQGATMALRYADVPVVVAPARAGARRRLRDRAARRPRAGGGGNLHGPRRGRRRPDSRAAAAPRRCWRGRWRASPAGARPAAVRPARVRDDRRSARSSTSGADAQRSATSRDVDAISMNRERLIADAKAAGARAGARRLPVRRRRATAIRVGGEACSRR